MKKNKPLRLVMDGDGVFVDFVHGVLQATHQLTGQTVRSDEITEWDLFTQLARLTGHASLERTLPECVKQEHFCFGLPPLPGAEDALKRLVALDEAGDIHLLIATAPWKSSRYWMYERSHWFDRRGLPFDRVIHTSVKHPIAADLFFDDKPLNVSTWQDHNPHGRAFLWNAHHNKKEETFQRCVGWEDFFQTLQEHLLHRLGLMKKLVLPLLLLGCSGPAFSERNERPTLAEALAGRAGASQAGGKAGAAGAGGTSGGPAGAGKGGLGGASAGVAGAAGSPSAGAAGSAVSAGAAGSTSAGSAGMPNLAGSAGSLAAGTVGTTTAAGSAGSSGSAGAAGSTEAGAAGSPSTNVCVLDSSQINDCILGG